MTKMAVALGGFGGFNLHGAGILTALNEQGIMPDLFTATSGQIVVLAEWLQGHDVHALLTQEPGSGPMQTLSLALKGHPGVFRPASRENAARWFDIPLTMAGVIERLLPARQFISEIPHERFEDIAAVLNAAEVGVVFNTYDFRAGEGMLHGNRAAYDLMPPDTKLVPITPNAVQSALWLYLYGFEEAPEGLIDGAYHRSIILAELHAFHDVYVACPFPTSWTGPTPSNSFEVEDWKIKQWFSNAYKAEVTRLRRVIDLISRRALRDPGYVIRNLTEIPVGSNWGYFDYFTEKDEVFQEALAAGRTAFAPRV
jgi:hypothetical protein